MDQISTARRLHERFKRCEKFNFLSIPLKIPIHITHDAAVAFIIRESNNGDLWVLLTKRVDSLSSHAGDVCLPGGMYDQSDHNLVNTALRETKEEVGINPEDLQYISTLPPYLAGHGGKTLIAAVGVTPVVFWLKRNVEVYLNASEAEVAFWTPLDFFLSTQHHNTITTILPSRHKFTIVMLDYYDPPSQSTFLIYGCTANICVTVSSIALNRSPEFPFTGMGMYWYEKELVLAEVSRTTLNSTSDYKPHTIKCKL
ncbi:uncharacterized protein [Dysidea avara]|uniref:uncharacterized protein n=1 Tax=Dysidea avara TaxID=196820 RepID=UPI00332F50AE